MQLNDFLEVLQAEFAQAADDVDASLAAWMAADPADAAAFAEPLTTTLERLATVARMVGLEGQALSLEQLRDAAQLATFSDEATLAGTLGWLCAWREPMTAVFEQPGDGPAADNLLDYLTQAPQPLAEELRAPLRELLAHGPALPRDDAGEREAAFPAPLPEDVSLEVSADVDRDLLESFLHAAPDQLAALSAAVQTLQNNRVDAEVLAEAQRMAHTFKGSGNIIGIRGVGRLAHRVEDLLDFAAAHGGTLPVPMARDLQQACAVLEQMIYALRGEEDEPEQAWPILCQLTRWAHAIADDRWEDLLAEDGADGAPERAVPLEAMPLEAPPRRPVAGATAAHEGAAPPVGRPAGEPSDSSSVLRVELPRIDALARRAGQQWVRQGRLTEGLSRLNERLVAIRQAQQALDTRLNELQAQIDRQGVSLQSRAEETGPAFDPLEMDRYNELHSLARLAGEMAADGQDHARDATAELQELAALCRQQSQDLDDQHADLLAMRLVPFRQIASRLQRNVAQTAGATGKPVQLMLEGEQTRLDLGVLERLTEPLLHLLRNAVDHGIEPPADRELLGKPPMGTIKLSVQRRGALLHVECRDDGGGLDLPAIHAKAASLGLLDADATLAPQDVARLILVPGFSTRDTVTDISGRGLGMDVVAQRLRTMNGTLDIQTEAFEGTCFTLELPATVGTLHALVVEVAGQVLALPSSAVVTALPAVGVSVENGQVSAGGQRWDCMALESALGWPAPSQEGAAASGRPVVVIRAGSRSQALWVDRVVEARELVLQDIGPLLSSVPGVSAGAIRADGRAMLVLDPTALIHRSGPAADASSAKALRERSKARRRRALVVDDSHSVRKSLAQLLGDAGWEVDTARDGFDALERLRSERVDIVLTDLEMPQLNGLELTRQIRAQASLAQLPVLMITSRDTAKHRDNARQAGVDEYLTKPCADAELLQTMSRLARTAA